MDKQIASKNRNITIEMDDAQWTILNVLYGMARASHFPAYKCARFFTPTHPIRYNGHERNWPISFLGIGNVHKKD